MSIGRYGIRHPDRWGLLPTGPPPRPAPLSLTAFLFGQSLRVRVAFPDPDIYFSIQSNRCSSAWSGGFGKSSGSNWFVPLLLCLLTRILQQGSRGTHKQASWEGINGIPYPFQKYRSSRSKPRLPFHIPEWIKAGMADLPEPSLPTGNSGYSSRKGSGKAEALPCARTRPWRWRQSFPQSSVVLFG